MLRAIVAALIVANLVALGWTFGWFAAIGSGGEREPERLKHQVNPQAIELIAPGAASAALLQAPPTSTPPARAPANAAPTEAAAATPSVSTAAASGPPADQRLVCLEAGPFAANELAAVERTLARELQAPTPAPWVSVKSERGGSFIVYQGKFADEAALAKRRDELRRAQIPFDEVRNSPDLQPGLSFGRYDSRAAADAALEELRQRGARAARVVMINAPVAVTTLRVERADAALAARLGQLSLPPGGSTFRPCAGTP